MNTTIQPFTFEDHQVRTVTIEGEPWFVLGDVCKVLEIANVTDAKNRLDQLDFDTTEVQNSRGQMVKTIIINESGLYDVILDSRKPQAKAFRRWITSEVIPSINKHGGYLTEQKIEEVLADPDTLIRLATTLKEERAKREALENQNRKQAEQIEQAAPKAEAYDRFMDSDGTYSVGNVAKMLGLSQNKLFTELRNNGVFIAKGHMRNTPYQQYMKHFTVKAFEFERKDNTRGTSYTTRIQPSGIDFICRKLNLTNAEVAA